MRPVPVVFLRFAFSPQLTVFPALVHCPRAGSSDSPMPSGEGMDSSESFTGRELSRRTLPGLSGGVSARGAGVLLDVHRAAT